MYGINKVTALFYSATGCTDQLAKCAAEEAGRIFNVPVSFVDYTNPVQRQLPVRISHHELLILAFPTYGNRLPDYVSDDLRRNLRGNDAPVIEIVTYGNRDYGDCLAEMTDIARRNGFIPVTAAVFPVRHAYTDLVGNGRPNDRDMSGLRKFIKKSCEHVNHNDVSKFQLKVPGNIDGPHYQPIGTEGKPVSLAGIKPKTDVEKCKKCGRCVELCPMGAISAEDFTVTGTCIRCQACVRGCPAEAKYFDDPEFLAHVAKLEEKCKAKKPIEYFYA